MSFSTFILLQISWIVHFKKQTKTKTKILTLSSVVMMMMKMITIKANWNAGYDREDEYYSFVPHYLIIVSGAFCISLVSSRAFCFHWLSASGLYFIKILISITFLFTFITWRRSSVTQIYPVMHVSFKRPFADAFLLIIRSAFKLQ